MLISMTGFARQGGEFSWGSASWEVRSVNHRYLEFSTRLPESLRYLEPQLRSEVMHYAKRGKIELSLKLALTESTEGTSVLNEALLQRILQAYQSHSSTVANASFDFAKLLTWQGVYKSQEIDLEPLQADLLALFTKLMQHFYHTKLTEGQAIAQFIKQRSHAIEQQVELAKTSLPKVLEQARVKLLNRLAEVQQSLDTNRLEQEMVLIAQRLDVAEELDRLSLHLKQVNELIAQGQGVGRRLDFLMQELNREANTLGSKANDIRMTQCAIEIKVLIEQMREQIQNVE